MQIEIGCTTCSNNRLGEKSPYEVHSRLCSVRDDGIYDFECLEGHRSRTVLLTPKHGVLFTIASNALLDGYFREAIVSFATCLERFYEFAIRVICRSKSIRQEDFDKCWKSVSKQSERQLGAFTMLWFVETKKPPKLPSYEMVKFRNNVIHDGKVPTYEECIEYGEAVIDVISPIESKLLDVFSDCYSNPKSFVKKGGEGYA